MLVQIIAARPCENEEAKKAENEQKAGFGRLVQLYISRIVKLNVVAVVVLGIHEV